ncbi:DUF3189 family protein [Geosporobacter ferrireducens]|uniref:DUF3189 family protein n=1 Tax=Geosporobacter ferrireducens TaxID=1424294 RepID=UPI002352AC9F|nr:DUF3189 family protein [Geosporobacter ferrireducens]
MYIIYHDIGGTHGPSIAAAIHLNELPSDEIPGKTEIEKLILSERFRTGSEGRLVFHGKDHYGHQIFSFARRYAPSMFLNAFSSIMTITKKDPKDLLYIDTMPFANTQMIIGGSYARRAGLASLGRPLLILGILQAYPQLSSLVWKTQLKLEP